MKRKRSRRSRYAPPDDLVRRAKESRAALAELLTLCDPVLKRVAAMHPGVPADDALQVARLGFLTAAERYDGRVPFLSYVSIWSHGLLAWEAKRLARGGSSSGLMLDAPDARSRERQEDVEDAIAWRQVQRLLDEVSQRDALVLEMRAFGRTLEDVGQVLGVSRERVRQIETTAPRRIRAIARRGDD